MKALGDELERSMSLQLEDLQSPYFIEYVVSDTTSHRISATSGAILNSTGSRARRLFSEVRVGYYDVDNTNFGGAGGRGFGGRRGGRRGPRGGGGGARGGGVALPTDDAYLPIRQAAWQATDGAYKRAVETYAQKEAYLEDRNVPDRPADFTRVEPVTVVLPRVELALDEAVWEQRLRTISARFLDHPHVLDSSVSLVATADNDYLINSEGTRIRAGDTSVAMTVTAQLLTADGEQISDRLVYIARSAGDLPAVDDIIDDVDGLARTLAAKAGAPVLEDYVGPVLFDGVASPTLFQTLLARGVAGRPEPAGGGRRRRGGAETLDKYIGKRILPRSFQVYDDPRGTTFGTDHLSGHYSIDDEGVPAQRVDLVVDGRLVGMTMSRVPTRRFAESNGHGRGAGGRTQAAIGCLYVEAGDAMSPAELKEALIEAALDQDLIYGVRVSSIGRGGGGGGAGGFAGRFPGGGGRGGAGGFGRGGGGSAMGDPVAIYKVYADGREELVRSCEFGELDVSFLKDIIAAGDRAAVHNTGRGATAASIIAPPVLIEEVELFTIEEERQRPPILEAPHRRDG